MEVQVKVRRKMRRRVPATSLRLQVISLVSIFFLVFSLSRPPKAQAGFDFYDGFNTVWNDLTIGQQFTVSMTVNGLTLGGALGGAALGYLGSLLVKHEKAQGVMILTGAVVGLIAGGVSGYLIALDAGKPDLKFGRINLEAPPPYLADFSRDQLALYNDECEEYTILFNRVASQLQTLAIESKATGKGVDRATINAIMFHGFQDAVDQGIVSQDTIDIAATMQAKAFGPDIQAMLEKASAP